MRVLISCVTPETIMNGSISVSTSGSWRCTTGGPSRCHGTAVNQTPFSGTTGSALIWQTAWIWCWVTALDAVVSDILIWPWDVIRWSGTLTFHARYNLFLFSTSWVSVSCPCPMAVSSVHAAPWRTLEALLRVCLLDSGSCFRGGSREEDERADARMR